MPSPSEEMSPRPLPSDAVPPTALRFSGVSAMRHVRALVELGPRPPGSPQRAAAEEYIVGQLQALGLQVERQRFEAATPDGPSPW